MATITFSINSTPLTASKTFTGTDADMQAILNWAEVAYAATIGTSILSPTNGQIGAGLATGTMNAWNSAALKFQVDPVKATAGSSIPPLTFS